MFNSTFQLHRNIQQSETGTFHFPKICCELVVNLKVADIKLRPKWRVLPLKDTKLISNTNK